MNESGINLSMTRLLSRMKNLHIFRKIKHMILKKYCIVLYATKQSGLKLWSLLLFRILKTVGKFWRSGPVFFLIIWPQLSFIFKQMILKYFSHLSCSTNPNTSSSLRAKPSFPALYLCQDGILQRILFASFLYGLCFIPSPQQAPWQILQAGPFVLQSTPWVRSPSLLV